MPTSLGRLLLAVIALMLAGAEGASAGWVIDRVTHTEGGPGPSSTVTLFISKDRIKELHDDGTYFLWDISRGTLFQVDPSAKAYSGGPVKNMIAEVEKYLHQMRERLAQMTDEQREELARRTEGLPMPVPPPATPPSWSVKATSKTATIAGQKAELFEIHRDGALFEERWIAPKLNLSPDLDYPRYATWSRELEASFTAGMGGSSPSGKEIEGLFRRGVELKSVLLGSGLRVVSEVTKIEKKEVPDSTFTLPPDYVLKGAQLSQGGRPLP